MKVRIRFEDGGQSTFRDFEGTFRECAKQIKQFIKECRSVNTPPTEPAQADAPPTMPAPSETWKKRCKHSKNCKVVGCDQLSQVMGFCRKHFIEDYKKHHKWPPLSDRNH